MPWTARQHAAAIAQAARILTSERHWAFRARLGRTQCAAEHDAPHPAGNEAKADQDADEIDRILRPARRDQMAMTIDSTPSNSTQPQPAFGRSLNASITLLTPLANRNAPIRSASDAIDAIGKHQHDDAERQRRQRRRRASTRSRRARAAGTRRRARRFPRRRTATRAAAPSPPPRCQAPRSRRCRPRSASTPQTITQPPPCAGPVPLLQLMIQPSLLVAVLQSRRSCPPQAAAQPLSRIARRRSVAGGSGNR